MPQCLPDAPNTPVAPPQRQRWYLVAALLQLLTIGCIPALVASGVRDNPSPRSGGTAGAGALLVADGSVCAKALVAAHSKLGSRYILGTKGPTTFDCSGLTRWAYAQAGVTLGVSTYQQKHDGQLTPCRFEDFHGASTTCWKPGDLIFLRRPAAGFPEGYTQHVAMYDRDGYIVGCENPQVGCIRQLPEKNSYYRDNFWMGRRIADCPKSAMHTVPYGMALIRKF
jgi:cell wall-associated NlpC family hydrolase